MRKRSGQVHSRESSATLQLTVSLLYHADNRGLYTKGKKDIIDIILESVILFL